MKIIEFNLNNIPRYWHAFVESCDDGMIKSTLAEEYTAMVYFDSANSKVFVAFGDDDKSIEFILRWS